MPIRFDRLNSNVPIVDDQNNPSTQFGRLWQKTVEYLEGALDNIDTLIAGLAAAVANITQILIDLGVAQTTADGALALAESAINPDGTIKANKVTTDSIAASSVTRTSTFFNDFGGYNITSGSWVDLSDSGITADVDIVTTAYASQGVLLDGLIAMNRSGGSDDNVSVRCVRTSDSTVMSQVYDFAVQGQNFTYAVKFYDSDPVDSITETYKLQVNSDDTTAIREVFLSGFLTLR